MPFEQLPGHSPQDPAPDALCDRIFVALAAAASYILNSFALHAACLHPELAWPLIDELARKKETKDAQSDGPSMDNVAQFRPRRRIDVPPSARAASERDGFVVQDDPSADATVLKERPEYLRVRPEPDSRMAKEFALEVIDQDVRRQRRHEGFGAVTSIGGDVVVDRLGQGLDR